MATAMTYDTLVADIRSYATRPDDAFLEKVPTFVMLGENQLAVKFKQQGFQTVVAGVFTIGEPTMAKPAFWRETIALNYTDDDDVRHPILLRGYDYCRNWNPASASGAPKFYADYNAANFYIVKTPDVAYPFELIYYAMLQPLDDTNQTNWLTLNMPQALFGACMLEAAIWQRNSGEITKWQGYLAEAMGSGMAENQERLKDRNVDVTRG